MLILIILLSSLLSLLIVALFEIKNMKNKIILFLTTLVAFILFKIIFNKIIKKNKSINLTTNKIKNNNNKQYYCPT